MTLSPAPSSGLPVALGEAIRAGRRAKGLTQQQLGDVFGISKSAVNMWEQSQDS